jgi:glycine hydroxymethyltransferase
MDRGHVLATGGTDNHLLLWNVRELGLTGSKVEKVLEMASITTNKNSIPGDTSALNPGGVRLGTPALTTRGLKENDFDRVADFLHRGCQIAIRAQEISELEQASGGSDEGQSKKVALKDYFRVLNSNDEIRKAIEELKADVEQFALTFEMP